MLTYEELYEFLRKEKFSEKLQHLPAAFIRDFSEYIAMKRKQFSLLDGFTDDVLRERKQYENALTLYKDLMLRRKRKILDLVFVAAETGIMKKDFADMLPFEQKLFEELMHSVENAEKSMQDALRGVEREENTSVLVIMAEPISAFVDMHGNLIGPFEEGNVAHLERAVANVLVSGGKARLVDSKD